MKAISKIIVLAAILLSIFACDKENIAQVDQNQQQNRTAITEQTTLIDQEKYPGVSVENRVLIFESIEYYSSLVSDESDSYNVDELTTVLNESTFESYGKKFGEESEYNDPFMDAIMNEEKVVKIGEWFIYIDIPSETVLALSDSEENAYTALLERSNRSIRKFSTGDDVLDHLANNTNPQERCGGIGGGTYVSNTLWIGTWFTEAYVDFFRAGIYFRLKAGAAPSSSGVFNQTIEVMGPEAWRRRKPCSGGSVGTSPAGLKNSGSGNFVWAFYTGVRNLNGYYLFARLRVETTSGTVFTTFAGRNINSPY